MCSFDLPTGMAGRTVTGSSSGNSSSVRVEHAAIDGGVDLDRQVRTMLLDRRHRQDGDRPAMSVCWKSGWSSPPIAVEAD